MGVLKRTIVFVFGTISNAILFIFHSRVILEVVDISDSFAEGPATTAINLLPDAMVLVIGGLQVVYILYLLGGLGQERTAARRPMP